MQKTCPVNNNVRMIWEKYNMDEKYEEKKAHIIWGGVCNIG